jgi:hypothetical protein
MVINPLMILVAGPYRSGTGDDPALIANNVAAMTDASLRALSRRAFAGDGRVVRAAAHRACRLCGYRRPGVQRDIPPISRRLLAKCDACLRIGGASAGADEMVALALQHGKPVYYSLEQVPGASASDTGVRR